MSISIKAFEVFAHERLDLLVRKPSGPNSVNEPEEAGSNLVLPLLDFGSVSWPVDFNYDLRFAVIEVSDVSAAEPLLQASLAGAENYLLFGARPKKGEHALMGCPVGLASYEGIAEDAEIKDRERLDIR